ncbi:hypothetical protein MKX29_07440 [Cytobacillus sp. FSL R7-0696]|uniref:hypothetical protein n=1 Tax=Cytobacillus sp. FSL R7-0696 TaxID=2921691 RepID=UPI0030FB4BDF
MKSKALTIGLASVFSLSIFTNGGQASAQSMDEQLTENHTVNWEEIWSNVGDYSEEVEFGNVSPHEGGIELLSMGSLATGSTAVSLSGSTVKSTGKSKGRILTTVTSATTSLRDIAKGYTSQGGKRMAVGTFTANSTTTLGNSKGKSPFTGVTVHTATDNGKLYSSQTGNTKSY